MDNKNQVLKTRHFQIVTTNQPIYKKDKVSQFTGFMMHDFKHL